MPSTGTRRNRKSSCGARGEPSSCTDSGPPERMTALGFIACEGGFGLLEGHDFRIDALLAHAARDQLRHLTAEIDDQNLVMRRSHGRRRRLRLAVLLSWGRNYATAACLATPISRVGGAYKELLQGLHSKNRHGRARARLRAGCPGYPRLATSKQERRWMAGTKPGHDERSPETGRDFSHHPAIDAVEPVTKHRPHRHHPR